MTDAPQPEANLLPDDETELRIGQVQWHCSEEGGGPDVGILLRLSDVHHLWLGELLAAEGDGFGFVLYGPGDARRVFNVEEYDEVRDLFEEFIAPALRPQAPAIASAVDEREASRDIDAAVTKLIALHKKMQRAIADRKPYPVSIRLGDDDTWTVLHGAIELERAKADLAALSRPTPAEPAGDLSARLREGVSIAPRVDECRAAASTMAEAAAEIARLERVVAKCESAMADMLLGVSIHNSRAIDRHVPIDGAVVMALAIAQYDAKQALATNQKGSTDATD